MVSLFLKGEIFIKAVPTYLYFILFGFFLILILGLYYKYEFPKNEKVLLLNEVIAAEVNGSTDLGKSRVLGELFMDIEAFEEKTSSVIKNKYPTAALSYEYLKNDLTGSIKAIRITMVLDTETFTTTYKLNESVGI